MLSWYANKKFLRAVREGNIEETERLLSNRNLDINAVYDSALSIITEKEDLNMLRILLSDPRTSPTEELDRATLNNNSKLVSLLLQDPNIDPGASLYGAAMNKNIEIIKLLLQNPRVNPNRAVEYILSVNGAGETVYSEYYGQYFYIKPNIKDLHEKYKEVLDLLMKDSRFNLLSIKDINVRNYILDKEKNKLKQELTSNYLLLEDASPQIQYGDKIKSQIPKRKIKNIVYNAPYQELCQVIEGNFPPVKLIALADILKIKYDKNTTYSELCGRVKAAILLY